jgi:hypothetical protein
MNRTKPPDWAGQTVAVIGSGPSLTAADLELVRKAGWRTIVTNRTWELAPWADALFAHDLKFWTAHGDRIEREFAGRLFSIKTRGRKRVEALDSACRWFTSPANSGAAALSIAIGSGARRIVLLGMDCQAAPDGARHWHAPYAAGVDGATNAASMPKWPAMFATIARRAEKQATPVINCSRATALTCFPRRALEAVLEAESIAAR